MEITNVIDTNINESSNFMSIASDSVDNTSNHNGASNVISDSLQNSTAILDINKNNNEKTNDVNINIYRYKFTNEFTDELYKFSKIHQYDHRKDFKEAWEIWSNDNLDLVEGEVRRLTNLGYDGDILDKMFKSARYYFRKKSTEKKAPAKRRIYVGSQKDLLEAMDEHIKSEINTGDFKPSEGFDEFCKKNIEIIKEQVNLLVRAGITDPNEVKGKIKKTYKNRYFLIISK